MGAALRADGTAQFETAACDNTVANIKPLRGRHAIEQCCGTARAFTKCPTAVGDESQVRGLSLTLTMCPWLLPALSFHTPINSRILSALNMRSSLDLAIE
jgi:hypothetical protein